MATETPHVVIVGGGFGGLYAARRLGNAPVKVTLVDRRNFHLFQPLLYQVATGGLSPADIASPLRAILRRYRNIRVLMDEVTDLNPAEKQLLLKNSAPLSYDFLILAPGGGHHYFGHDEWAEKAPGLKTLEDAVDIRKRIFSAFEAAERETDAERRKALLTFLIIGGGPTGVELAGALGELARYTLRNDFRQIDPTHTRILLLEGSDRLLATYPAALSQAAGEDLRDLGVTVRTGSMVTEISGDSVCFKCGESSETIQACTVLWAAGVKPSGLGKTLGEKTGAPLDKSGRVMVESDLSVPQHQEIFVIGDLAHYAHQDGKPLPGVAPVAMQEGHYVAGLIKARVQGKNFPAFRYKDKGSLAVIGRNEAVADLGRFKLRGFVAWVIWVFVHIGYLIEFRNKLLVLLQWGWSYATRRQGARLITEAGTPE